MKGPRLTAAILLLSIALVCFISTPVLSGGDPWDVDGDSDGGSGTDSDTTVVPDDPFDNEMDRVDDGYGSDWLSGLVFEWTYQVITYVLGDDVWSSDPKRVVVDKSSNNVVGH